ncbi:MAG: CHAT domain-containing protein [Chloracidobacterium sp.]|nr:CHAT domain-containing protein [Chloracidobacterium sp.]
MRPLVLTAISALILCSLISIPLGFGLHSTLWPPVMINPFRVVMSAAENLRQLAKPAQASASERGTAQYAQESIPLEPGKPIDRELSGGQSHSYKITLISGQYLHIVVEQRGIDVVVALFTPDGKKISEANSQHFSEGSETVSAIAEASGAYLIQARSAEKTAKTGRYEIKVEELRAATAEDKYRVAGESVFREAEQLKDGTLEEKRKSIEKYQEALELYRRAGDRKGEAEILNNIGAVYWSLGEMQKALEKFNEALPLRREAGDRRGEAVTLHYMGAVYRSIGEMQKALEKYDEALSLSREVGDRGVEAIILGNIGTVYRLIGEMQKALEKYDAALSLERAVGARDEEAATLKSIGDVYHSIGEIQKALEKFNEALLLSRAAGDRSEESYTLNDIGLVYQSLGETQKALEKFNEALPLSRELGDRGLEAATLNNIGLVYKSLDETQKALEKFNEALPLSRAVGNRGGEATILKNIGVVYRMLGDMQKALEKFNEALPLSRAVGHRILEALTLNDIGVVYRSLGETQKALEKFNEALPLSRAVGHRSGEIAALLGIAQAEQNRGNLTYARQIIEQAISVIESLRTNIPSQELRASYFASKQDFFESYIDILMQMHKQDPDAAFDAVALAVNERARARSLLELLTESRADIRQGVDSKLLERERFLQQRLNAKAAAQVSLLNRKHTPEQADAADKEIDAITSEFEETEAQIRTRSPRYAALTQPQPLGLTEIQKQVLDPDTLLLEYSLGENASYLFVISQKSITSYRLPKRAEIEAAARRVRELLTAQQPQTGDTEAKYKARVNESEENYWAKSSELSRMLLGPAASQLGKKRLAIVTDGALQYVPFAAMPSPFPANNNGRNAGAEQQPLLVEHEIVSLPSASTLATLRHELAGRKPAERSLAVLADPVFTYDDVRVKWNTGKVVAQVKTRSADSDETDITSLQITRSGRETGVVSAEAGFGRLLNSRREAKAILALVPEKERMQALDFEASRTTAQSPELGEYRIVHFATHGLLNNVHPELSGLVLSLVDESGKPQDGFLRLQDIYNLKLSADLVTLSACQTGLGKEIKGEGLIGLARGFMYAGSPRVVASLWKVDDRATSELMKRFYQEMLGPEALSAAAALRQAQLSVWNEKQWREPYYWAAFVLQGEWK